MIAYVLAERYFKSLGWPKLFAVLWIVWLFTGMTFYNYTLDVGWAKGFHKAVDVGYSVGWGDPSTSEEGNFKSQWFSVFYVLCGASFIAAALGFFAQKIVEDRAHWYENELMKRDYQQCLENSRGNYFARGKIWCLYNLHKLRAIIIWCLFIIVGTACAWNMHEDFNFINALYFCISSLSTGGLYGLPADADSWHFGLTGLYTAIGVPIMGIAMATLASFFIDGGDLDDAVRKIKQPVTEKEVLMLTDFDIANDDGVIDKAEFIILCMVRIGAATPDLIKLVTEYFSELDLDNDGTLTMEEICKRQNQASAAMESVIQHARQRRRSTAGKRSSLEGIEAYLESIRAEHNNDANGVVLSDVQVELGEKRLHDTCQSDEVVSHV